MKIEEPIVENGPDVPPEASMSGINSYCISCPALQRQAGYPVCLHTLQAMEENRLRSEDFSDCQRAVTHGDCKAKYMREMERKAKKALFFRPRIVVVPQIEVKIKDKPDPSPEILQAIQDRYPSLRTKGYKPAKLDTKPTPKPKQKLDDTPVAMDMGKMASDLAQEHLDAKPKKILENHRPMKGESIRDWARRIASKK